MYEYIRVNVPHDYDEYLSGNGEGCWALAEEDVKALYDADAQDEPGETHRAILDNDCLAWPFLRHGCAIEIEMRGEFRPVVSYEFLRRQALTHGAHVPEPWPTPADLTAFLR